MRMSFRYSVRAGAVGIAPREFVIVQHAIRELDIERRPGRPSLVGGSRDLVDHLVPRIIRGHQEVECAGDAKARLRNDQIRRGREQRALARLAHIPEAAMHADEIQRDRGHRRARRAIQGMPDIAALAEQPEQVPLVLRQVAPEQPLQLVLVDNSELHAPHERRVDAGIGDETPALGARVGCRGARSTGVAQQIRGAIIIERLELACELEDRALQITAIFGQQQAAGMRALRHRQIG